MTHDIELTRGDGVLTIELRRAEKKNAITGAMYEAMIAAFDEADRDPQTGAILIRGSEGVFTAGNDIGDFIASAQTPTAMAAWRFVENLASLETPLVAAIEGLAIGIGTTLILHCDLVYAAPDAKFKMPFVDLGLVPEAGSSLLLPQRVGLARASEMLMLAESFDAAEAHRLGLVNAILPNADLYSHATERARMLASKPRAAMATTRRLLRGDRSALNARMREEAQAFSRAMQSDEARQAFASFMARSKPAH
ncbi:MAG: enoyl-CoA hydratase [Beijerinckiaceae bacterium]|jgi:enoyl-CoA hydratase/carnithine racemase|nr:enoyl-CoA hydratase [Beijerinckiaceae bacterium]